MYTGRAPHLTGTARYSQNGTCAVHQTILYFGTLRCRWMGAVRFVRSGHEQINLTELPSRAGHFFAELLKLDIEAYAYSLRFAGIFCDRVA